MRIFYTVLMNREGFPLKYFDWQAWKVQRLNGSFATIEKAKDELQTVVDQENEVYYLEPQQFASKVRSVVRMKGAKERWQVTRSNKGQQ